MNKTLFATLQSKWPNITTLNTAVTLVVCNHLFIASQLYKWWSCRYSVKINQNLFRYSTIHCNYIHSLGRHFDQKQLKVKRNTIQTFKGLQVLLKNPTVVGFPIRILTTEFPIPRKTNAIHCQKSWVKWFCIWQSIFSIRFTIKLLALLRPL